MIFIKISSAYEICVILSPRTSMAVDVKKVEMKNEAKIVNAKRG